MAKITRQKDIAEKLGLSRSLVTKVLNGNLGTTQVRPETAKAILDLADKLGYRPDPRSRSLLTGRGGVIGAMVRRFGIPASGLNDLLTRGLCEEAERLGQTLLVSYFDDKRPGKCIEWLAEARHIDGLIIAGRAFEPTLDQLEHFEAVPATIILADPPSKQMSHVSIDGCRIGYVATKHLIQRGCRRIAHIHNNETHLEGWQQALTEASIPIDDELVYIASSHNHTEGVNAVQYFMKKGVRFDGLAAQSDSQAAGAINELKNHNITVPGQVKVIGVDNAPFCDFFPCPISSVDANYLESGRLGMKILMKMINDKDRKPRHAQVEPILVTRRSTE